ncbi:ribonuclease III domain-containing protein [Pholiota molesta]|nr:ribonuclease III domain-containing protein [Pholiota molesta]
MSKKKAKGRNKKPKTDEKGIQWLGDKAIADVAEAIIGAAYISGGREAALQATKALTIPLSNIDRWSDFGRKVLTPPPNATAKLKPGSIAAIEKIIGHKFNRPHLLGQAMTHSSIQGYEATSYERLEFIGDAILDFMVIRHIFDRDQQLSPGALTMLKGAMVSNSALAAVCVWSGLQEYLLFESPYLENSIRAYANELKEKQAKEYALAEAEGRSPGQYWLDIEPPKALSDVVESIAGAIYISDNFDPVGAETLFDNVLKPFYDKHITLQTLSHHPTKILFELLQAQGCQNFELTKDKDESVNRCHVVVHDVILVSAEDSSPTSAARLASFLALDALEGDADFMTRTCDCRTHIQQKKGRQKSEFEKALEKALAGEGDDADEE